VLSNSGTTHKTTSQPAITGGLYLPSGFLFAIHNQQPMRRGTYVALNDLRLLVAKPVTSHQIPVFVDGRVAIKHVVTQH
jgi:hypothetical protein